MKRFIFLAVVLQCAWPLFAIASSPPNVVFIVVDNVGYGDVGSYGNPEIKTPNIDRLARQGVRLTHFYAPSPTCAVTRASILTGRYPQRHGLTVQLSGLPGPNVDIHRTSDGIGVPHSEIFLPEILQRAGYATGAFGKWNVGFAPGSRPTERGFDEFFGSASGFMDYYRHTYRGKHDLFRGTEPVRVEGYSTDLFADNGIDFIRRHASEPFFLYLPFNAVHFNPTWMEGHEPVSWQAPDQYFELYGASPETDDQQLRYKVVVSALDHAIGRVLFTLDDLGLTDDTLVIFFSDNGAFLMPNRGEGVASNDPFRGGGTQLWEGGIRVPTIVRWPGKIPAGSVSHEPLIGMDLFSLIAKAAGASVPDDRVIDGRDPTAVLAGEATSPHQALFFKFGRMETVRCGQYKLVRELDKPWELYDLVNDIGESRNLAADKPRLVADLRSEFEVWLEAVSERPNLFE